MNEAKRDSSDQCLWVGTPVTESTFFVHAGNNGTIQRCLLDTRNMMFQKVIKKEI